MKFALFFCRLSRSCAWIISEDTTMATIPPLPPYTFNTLRTQNKPCSPGINPSVPPYITCALVLRTRSALPHPVNSYYTNSATIVSLLTSSPGQRRESDTTEKNSIATGGNKPAFPPPYWCSLGHLFSYHRDTAAVVANLVCILRRISHPRPRPRPTFPMKVFSSQQHPRL